MGDFNEVRCIEERWGSVFNSHGANAFNSFISNSGLNDIQLEGFSFTWAHPSATKMSKLDRPILLKEVFSDFGPTPLRFYHSWLELPRFDDLVSKSWNSFTLDDSNGMIRFKKKLQMLKKEIRAWTLDFKRHQDLLQKVPHHGIDLWLQVQIFYDHVNHVTRQTIDQLACGKLRDLNAEESWALLEDLALYDNESWNDPRDFAKPVKAIALPQDVPSTSDRRLIELENQVQRLMEAYPALTQPTQVNKIITSCEVCSGPHDTHNCMEVLEQAFVEYASSSTDEAGEGLVSKFMAPQDARLSKFEADFKQQQSQMTNKIDTVLKAITDRIASMLPSDTVKNPKLGQEEKGNLGNINPNPHSQPDPLAFIATEQVRKLNSMLELLGLVPQSSNTKFVCTKEDDGKVMFIDIIRDDDEPQNESPNEGEGTTTEGLAVEYFDTFPTRDELTYHKMLANNLKVLPMLNAPDQTSDPRKGGDCGNHNLQSLLHLMEEGEYNSPMSSSLSLSELGNVSNRTAIGICSVDHWTGEGSTYMVEEGKVREQQQNLQTRS
ncbi:hypothetical protein Tco_0802827 [Tanacetum coccineum]|uniref:MAK10-like protein n=1 Tax=Tanacetum coccineum TaxID=301880 RepID=A0ABQ4ZZX2_9ASTR